MTIENPVHGSLGTMHGTRTLLLWLAGGQSTHQWQDGTPSLVLGRDVHQCCWPGGGERARSVPARTYHFVVEKG